VDVLEWMALDERGSKQKLFDLEERRVQSHAVHCADLESVKKSHVHGERVRHPRFGSHLLGRCASVPDAG
jgi:hypothetical protein